MTLNQFTNHIKHNSIIVSILRYETDQYIYTGTIGSYKTSVIKQSIGDADVLFVEIIADRFIIHIKLKGGESNE